ncbi:MAG: hypothetical protein NTX50_26685 [Candidatus Sumerlaeota bacterium]|nr:hypothetical protein [Candidatus Sumerlaeota bacterium]
MAKISVDAQVVDREKSRAFNLRGLRSLLLFAILIIIMFVGLLVAAMAMNKDQVVLEIVKAVVLIGTGGAGGYAVGRYKNPTAASSREPKDSE